MVRLFTQIIHSLTIRGLIAVKMRGTEFYRRFRMTIDLRSCKLPQPHLPSGYKWIPFREEFVSRHAIVKHESFRSEIDISIFPNLSSDSGCEQLMRAICQHQKFLESATWLITTERDDEYSSEDCATIQGLAPSPVLGEIQNVGVAPEYRGLGLGRALVVKALHGFRESGLKRVQLEVTAHNKPAVELYRSIGFKLTQTMFKPVLQPISNEVISF